MAMRDDSLGFFWEDLPVRDKRGVYDRPMPPIPETGWSALNTFPRLKDVSLLAIDCETKDTELTTKGPGFRRTGDEGAHIVGLAVGTDDGGRWYFPMRHTVAPEQNMNPEAVLSWARDNICASGQTKIGANISYDVDALWSEGVPVTGPFLDVQYAEALLDENRRTYALEGLGKFYLGEGKVKDELKDWVIRAYGDESNYRANIWRAPPCLVGPYAEGDVDLPLRVYAQQKVLLEQQGLTDLFEMECSLQPQLIRMRQRGVKIDLEYAKRLDDELTQAIELADARLVAIAGRAVDVNSGADLKRLFDAAGVQYPFTATGKPSFAKEFLEHCAHPAAVLITNRRKLEKYRNTFVRGYVLNLNVNGRLHALFHPLKGDDNGAVSGRFSSSLPNLQNIPIRDPVWGPKLRALFIPEDGEIWGRHDWSQIEYRFLAHYARGRGSDEVRQRYINDPKTDFHDMTKSLIHDVTGVTLERKPVKNINFGLCIAAGQRVLTKRGLVPIQDVENCDLLWDGVEWVTHEGVVNTGTKKVITYEGLTATPEHIVWTDQGREVCFGFAASQSVRLERTGTSDGYPLGSWDAAGSAGLLPKGAYNTHSSFKLFGMWVDQADQSGQLQGIPELYLPKRQVPRSTGSEPRNTLRCDDPTVSANHACERCKLQGSWYQGIVQIARTLYSLGVGQMARANIQGSGLRSQGQRWTLLTGQPTTCHAVSEPYEQTAKVYDIVNAGPRNRFTCEGVLVHNCYGMGKTKLTNDLGLNMAAGERLFKAYHTGVPFVKDTYEAAQSRASTRGFIRTILGRYARFNLWEPVFGQGVGLPQAAAQSRYGDRIRRAYTHKTLNRLLQGSAADLMKTAMVQIDKAGIEVVLGPMLLTCHDETGHSVPRTPAAQEALNEVKHIMETCLKLKVPVIAEQSVGNSWGECK